MNEVYAEFFGATNAGPDHGRGQFAIPDMKVEIDCIAYKTRG